jgi:hypothetical protein
MGVASTFLRDMFGPRSSAPVCIVSYANDKSQAQKFPPVELYTRDPDEIERFVKRYDKPGRAVYFGVNTVAPGKKRSKENIAEITALHADLDFKGIVEDRKQIEAVLAKLPLKLSRLVFSGNGLHPYWDLAGVTPELTGRVEAALKRLCWALAGDPQVAEIARVMRLPGSHNSKDNAWKAVKVVTQSKASVYELKQLEQWLASINEPLLHRVAPKTNGHADPYAATADDQMQKPPLDLDEVWDDLQFHGEDGNGVHATELKVSAALLNRGEPVEEIVAHIREQIEARVPESRSWNWEEEVREIRKQCIGMIVKSPELLELQEAKPHWLTRDKRIKALLEIKKGNGHDTAPAQQIVPINLWDQFPPAPLPSNTLPKVIEAYAIEQGKLMGCDPVGMAMAALSVAATVIPDSVQLQVMRHGNFKQSARLWVALIGGVSVMKTPVILEATRELRNIDQNLSRAYASEMAAYAAMSAEEKRNTEAPRHTRVRLEDTTTEAAAVIIKDSPEGVLLSRDELSGWFGSLGKYSGGNRGASADRGFWLQAYNGGYYSYDRVKRGSHIIENLSVNVLGGIQPTRIQAVADEGTDDGLIQRMIPVILQDSVLALDAPLSPEALQYDDLIKTLHGSPFQARDLRFSDQAQEVQYSCARRHLGLRDTFASFNSKLAEHFGKYDGMFARLCVVWHCIEHFEKRQLPGEITAETAKRVAKFMEEFMLPHAIAFYVNVLGLSDNSDQLLSIASYILTHKPKNVTNRDIQRSSSSMRGLDRQEAERVFHQLQTLGWVIRISPRRAGDPPSWDVNPMVHEMFEERTEIEKRRRAEVHKAMTELYSKVRK